jgi:hypothetical protein
MIRKGCRTCFVITFLGAYGSEEYSQPVRKQWSFRPGWAGLGIRK